MNSEFKREIYDGRTKEHEMDIEQKTRDPDRIFNLDDFVHLGGRLNEKLNDSLKKWKNFSQNRYLVNFLCEVFSYDCPENFRRKLFEEQETGRRLSGSSKKILTDLTELLVRRIEEIGDDEIRNILEKKYTPEVIRDNFEDLTEDFFLYFLAPVCNRDSDSVRIFLQRVFKRDSLSNYKTDEYLLGMAMDIYRQGIQESTIEILYKLRNCYDSVSPAREPEVISEKNGSQYITNKSRLYLEIQSGVFRPEDYPQIPETLSWYKAAVKPPARNKEKVYKALFDGIFRLYEKEMDDYLRIEAEEKEKRAKLRHRQEGSVPITLWYRSREPIWISGRTRFSGKNCVYELLKGENLMPMEYVEVCLHVIPHQDNSELQKPKRSAVPEGAVFEILCGNAERDGKPLIRSVRAVSIKKVNTEKAVNISEESGLNSRLWTKPKWRLEDCRNSPANGFVVIEILAEEEIPGNLCFAYEFEGKKFKYVPVREETGCSYLPRKTVTAYLDMNLAPFKNARRERDNYVLEGADSITQMEPKQESVAAVSNLRNRVVLSRTNFDNARFDQTGELWPIRPASLDDDPDMEKITVKNLLMTRRKFPYYAVFQRYMYGQGDYDEVSGLDMELSKKIGLDMQNLTSDWLSDSMVLGDRWWFRELSRYRQRSVVLVLLFLQYIKEQRDVMVKERETSIRNFRRFIDVKMDEFRFDGLYLGYPLDCLLLFLLSSCAPEDMCDTLRMIYKENERKKHSEWESGKNV